MQKTRYVLYWLYLSAFMVFAMAVIGAITRLTESGLSITEWKPLIGALPPMNDAEWMRVFDLYRQTPEYIHKNAGMTMDEFKTIFFWEWFHRLWGRLIGIVYAVPMIYFWVCGYIPAGFRSKLLGLLLLGGLQGFMGWYMVQSGLVDRPSVSHYRLAMHLSLAAIIYGAILAVAFDLRRKYLLPVTGAAVRSRCIRHHGVLSLFMVAVTIIWGAFVAGLDAGLIYNEFPMMGAGVVPYELTHSILPLWIRFVEDHAVVQFTHRVLAVITACVVIAYAVRVRSLCLALAVLAQVSLGIATLLSGVDIRLAALHQAGAFIVVALLLRSFYFFGRGGKLFM